MAAQILLTSESFVKSVTSISDNIAGKFLLPAIREAQDVGLRGIVGDRLLDKLKADFSDGSLSGIYAECVEQAQYFLAYTAVVELANKVTYKVSNFGVAKSNDENLAVVSADELAQATYFWQSKADAACLDFQNWLLRNRSALPELSACACNRIAANLKSAASCGLFLGGARGKVIGPKCGRR